MDQAEIQEERADAVADIREDGAPVVLRYDGSSVSGRERTTVAPVDVQCHAVLLDFRTELVDGESIRHGDLRILVADAALGELADEIGQLAPGTTPSARGITVHVGTSTSEDDYPTPGASGVKAYRVLRRLNTKNAGDQPVVHYLQARV